MAKGGEEKKGRKEEKIKSKPRYIAKLQALRSPSSPHL